MIALKSLNKDKARKWMWISLTALALVQLNFVQELLAAMIIFTAVFSVFAVIAVLLFLLDRASQRTVAWVEPQAKQVVGMARRAGIFAELNRRLHHRPHSQTVR